MRFEELIKEAEIRATVRKKEYSMAKMRSAPPMGPGIFAVMTDGHEISVVAEADHELDVVEEERPLRVITFEMYMPAGLVGFLAHMTGLMADNDIPLLAISTFSTDHILVKDMFVERAVQVLSNANVRVEQEQNR